MSIGGAPPNVKIPPIFTTERRKVRVTLPVTAGTKVNDQRIEGGLIRGLAVLNYSQLYVYVSLGGGSPSKPASGQASPPNLQLVGPGLAVTVDVSPVEAVSILVDTGPDGSQGVTPANPSILVGLSEELVGFSVTQIISQTAASTAPAGAVIVTGGNYFQATGVANTNTQVIIAGVAGKQQRLQILKVSYNATPVGGRTQVLDGATTAFDLDISQGGLIPVIDGPGGLVGTSGSSMTITLFAGGGGVIGKISAVALAA